MNNLIRDTRFLLIGLFITATSCTDFVQVEVPNSMLASTTVFEHDETAMAAANGMYNTMLASNSIIGGLFNNMSYLGGLSSDELLDYTGTDVYVEFYTNSLSAGNSVVFNVWSSAYKTIYEANGVIEGVRASNSLSEDVKRQVEGEAKFFRALNYFYLVNLFNDVPLVTTTDYVKNSTFGRTPATEIYDQIISDLKDAKDLLSHEYFTQGKTRPNGWAASALLARVHLFTRDYANAEAEATSVINVDSLYTLESDPGNVFLANNDESIWELSQVYPYGTPTGDAFTFVQKSYGQSITEGLLSSFEVGDNRKASWVYQDGSYYYPYKYKTPIYEEDASYPEHLVVLRLAEQYLIRSEARLELGNIMGSKNDLNMIRNRAGLPDTTADDKDTLKEAIQHERRIELFCEFGHRWLDLKRTEMAHSVMEPVKPTWNSEDVFYPIPASEMNNNPFLKPQNSGY